MNRRQLFRRALLGTAGAAASRGMAAAREFASDYDASRQLARPDWKPVFLDDHQNATLIAVSEVIIPETDTPGAKTALVNRFVDQLLAAEAHDVRRKFLDGLAFLDGEAFSQYRAAFVHLTPEQQRDLVAFIAYPHTLVTWQEEKEGSYRGHEHFAVLKDWISRAYYSSEAGMRALGYDGPPHGVFEGCRHPEGHQ